MKIFQYLKKVVNLYVDNQLKQDENKTQLPKWLTHQPSNPYPYSEAADAHIPHN